MSVLVMLAQAPQCIGPFVFPNVLPEGLEDTNGCADVLMPWGIAWLREVPVYVRVYRSGSPRRLGSPDGFDLSQSI